MPMNHHQEQQVVAQCLRELRDELPETFGLRAFPGDRFRIAPTFNPDVTSPHFYSDHCGGVQIVVQRDCGERGWLDMGRNTPAHIRREVRR